MEFTKFGHHLRLESFKETILSMLIKIFEARQTDSDTIYRAEIGRKME